MKVERRFFIGDEWVYFKIYANVSIQNRLLINEIYDLVSELYKAELIDKFFFIRYSDNDGSHLRLRFHLKDINDLLILVGSMNKKIKRYIRNRVILKVVTDTYVREIERYGEKNIVDVESIFSINSMLNLNLLKRSKSAEQDDIWLCSVSQIDLLLNFLQYKAHEKHVIYEGLYKGFSSDFNVDHLKKKYRENRLLITKIIKDQHTLKFINQDHLIPGSENIIIEKIYTRYKLNAQDPVFKRLIQDLIHMNFNRLFSHNQNVIESIIYYMMSNYYKSISIQEQKLISPQRVSEFSGEVKLN